MVKEISQTPFQVNCPRCHVSFPVGTKRCIHCGERIVQHRGIQTRILPPVPSPFEEGPDLSEDEIAPRKRFISPMTLVWIAAAVWLGIQRSCNS
jgi:hypothetical protein